MSNYSNTISNNIYDENSKSKAMDHSSRTSAAIGLDTIKNLQNLTILIIGMNGIGIETAKNIILTGLKECIIHDNDIVKVEDLGTNFYLKNYHIGNNTLANASLNELSTLNPLGVRVNTYDGTLASINYEYLLTTGIGAIIITKTLPKSELIRLNKLCRSFKKPIIFILAITHGLTGTFFSDFGEAHTITDKDGENKRIRIVSNITSDYKIKIALEITQNNHDLDDGLYITFDEVEGANLNKNIFKIKRLFKTLSGPPKREILDIDTIQLTHSIIENPDDTYTEVPIIPESLGIWTKGGIITEVKSKKIVKFQDFETSIFDAEPNMGFVYHPNGASLFSGVSNQIHYAFHAVTVFLDKFGRFPKLHDRDDASKVVEIAKELLIESKKRVDNGLSSLVVDSIDETIVTNYSLFAKTELPGYAAFLGGFAAQEVHKKFGKFTPIHQWFHVDHFCLLEYLVKILFIFILFLVQM